jgi:pyruvate formate lyase activating enzyme
MIIGGLQRFSLVDFPGRICAIVFTRGCNFRCPYCHNPELVDPARYGATIPEEEFFAFLGQRIGQLQGVSVSGGEPTIHKDLPDFLAAIKGLGLATKIDTNGTNPDLLSRLLRDGLLDYVAMDIKAPLSAYERVTRVPAAAASLSSIERSVRLVIDSSIPNELRTTFVEGLLSLSDMKGIAELVKGCASFVVQRFKPTKALDGTMLEESAPSESTMSEIRSVLEAAGLPVTVR